MPDVPVALGVGGIGAVLLVSGLNGVSVARVMRGDFKSAGKIDPAAAPTATAAGAMITGAVGSGSAVSAASAAQSALGFKSGYSQARPFPSTLAACATRATDCSGFVTLCYKAAGLPDPNSLNYNGSGYTGTLESHGHPTSSPQPGDLHFWQAPDHTAIDIGGGQVISWGSAPGPRQLAVTAEAPYHARYLGARAYP